MLQKFTFILLMCVLLIGISNVQGAQPQVVSAVYFDSLNVLQIVFDQPVYTDSTHIIRGGITLDGDNGGVSPDVTLTGGILTGIPELSDTINIHVNFANQNSIETMADRNTLELVLSARSFVNSSFEGNEPVTVNDDIAVLFIEDIYPPVPIQVSYDADLNHLKLIFSEVVERRTIGLTRIALSGNFGGRVREVAFSSDNEEIITSRNSDNMEIDISPNHQRIIEAFDNLDSIKLKLDRNAFRDLDRNSNKIIAPDDGVIVTFIPDSSPTTVDSSNYDATENKLRIYFNEKVVTSYWDREAVVYEGITLYDDTNKVTLSGKTSVSVSSNTILIIEVLPVDQRLIESLPHKDNLKLTLTAYSILDANGNGIRAFTPDDNITVSYKEEDPEKAPFVTNAKYDAVLNELELNFDNENISGTTRGIDTVSVNLAGITIDDDMGGINPDFTLTGGVVRGIKTGVPKFIRKIIIEVTSEDEARIERLANKNSLFLILEPLSFFFESYTKTRNGNYALETGNVAIDYIPDTLAAEVRSVKYDYLEDRLYLTFDKLIQYNKFQPTGIEIGGTSLTGGIIRDTSYTSEITLDVNAADQGNIENLAFSTKTNLQVKINAGSILNLDDVSNPTISFYDGDTTASGDTVFVGYGRKFWDRAFEAFPTEDQLIPASLRSVGDHSYFYVADEQWTRWVEIETDVWAKLMNQSQIDSLRDAFEYQTPANASKGMYQICREVFGQERNTDADDRIYILLLDIRDEYEVGGNNRLNDLAKAGYFEPRNALPSSEYAHSNEVDMIYIDTYPVFMEGKAYNAIADMFQRMISNHVDPNEEQWLVEGMSAMAQLICGYDFHTYQFPTKTLVPSSWTNTTQNGLTDWVAWSGGLLIDISNVLYSYFFTLYLYEQYGGQDLLKSIASDTTHGLASIDNVLSSRNETARTFDIFDDFAIACYLNIVDHPIYGDKYGFRKHKRGAGMFRMSNPLGPPGQVLITWSTDASWSTGAQWSINYFKVKQQDIPNSILFNGDNEGIFSFQIASIDSEFSSLQKMVLDSLNESYLELPQYATDAVLVVCNKTAPDGPVVSPFIVTIDNEPSDYVNLSVLQNPSVNRLLDIYVFSKERLFQDVPFSTVSDTIPSLGEGPLVSITVGNTTADIIAQRDFTNTEQTMFAYHLEYVLGNSGEYDITVSGQDMSGNNFAPKSTTITVRKMLAKSGGTIADAEGNVSLVLKSGCIAKDSYFTLSTVKADNKINVFSPESRKPVSDIFRLGPTAVKLLKPATLSLKYESGPQVSTPAIYRLEDSKWIYVGGEVNPENQTVVVQVVELGEFQVQAGEPDDLESPSIPDVFSLSQNYPNPFNPATVIQYGLPQDSDVTIKIYNLLGHEVATVVNKHQSAGYYQITWDATNHTSGMYLYKLEVRTDEGKTSFSQIRKMTVIK